MGDILSQEEIDQLLSVAEGSDEVKAATATASSEAIDEVASQQIAPAYDFRHPARVNKDQLRTLESLHDKFAQRLSATLSQTMRAVVDVDTAFVDQTTYAEFIMALSNPSCSCHFTLGSTKGRAVLDVAMPLAFAFVDRVFGGRGSSQGVDARQLTAIEMGMIDKIVKRAIEDLEAIWEPILRAEISEVELETNPEFMRIATASEIVILLAFEVNSTNASGLMSLCYPFFTLEPILSPLMQGTCWPPRSTEAANLQLENRLRMGNMPLPFKAELARGWCTVGEAQRIEVGDVLRLETRLDEPVVVHVGGEPMYLAVPFVGEDGRMKLKIAGEIPLHQRCRYRGSPGFTFSI